MKHLAVVEILRILIYPITFIAIGDEAFRGCSDIKNIDLPDNLESIGSRAFKDCRFDYIKYRSVVRMGSGVLSGSLT